MKLLFILLACCASSFCLDANSYESYMATIAKVTTFIQDVSQKITFDMINQTATRSGESFSTKDYSNKMIQEIENEITHITSNKTQEQISKEDQDLIEMFQQYIKQLEMCASFA